MQYIKYLMLFVMLTIQSQHPATTADIFFSLENTSLSVDCFLQISDSLKKENVS